MLFLSLHFPKVSFELLDRAEFGGTLSFGSQVLGETGLIFRSYDYG